MNMKRTKAFEAAQIAEREKRKKEIEKAKRQKQATPLDTSGVDPNWERLAKKAAKHLATKPRESIGQTVVLSMRVKPSTKAAFEDFSEAHFGGHKDSTMRHLLSMDEDIEELTDPTKGNPNEKS